MKTRAGRWMAVLSAVAAGSIGALAAEPTLKVTEEEFHAQAANNATVGAPATPGIPDDSGGQKTLEWFRRNLREAYDRVGKRDPRWDAPARRALDEYALVLRKNGDPDGSRIKAVGAAAHEAVRAGCNDPLIVYVDLRFGPESGGGTSSIERAAALRHAAQEMMDSEYPAIRKYFICLRASGNLARNPLNQTKTAEADLLLRRKAVHYLAEAMRDKTMPIEQVFDAWSQIEKRLRYDTEEVPGRLEQSYQEIEKPLFESWPKESTSYLIKGNFYIEHGWSARSSAIATSVTEQGRKLFGERLAVGAEALETAWKMNPKDPRIAISMITLETGQGKGRDRMELWFNRAMNLDTNSYTACNAKAYYLEPKWFGSPEEMLAFGRECLGSTNWGGSVPMIVVHVHEVLAGYAARQQLTNYWKKPGVWADIQAAYEKYLPRYPQFNSDRAWYAIYAARCDQWEDFDRIIERSPPLPENENLDVIRFNRLLRKKDHSNAYKLAARISEAHPGNAKLQNSVAWPLVTDAGIEKPDLELAGRIASRANDAAQGQDPAILDTLARVRFMQGKKAEAISLEEKAVALATGARKTPLEKALEAYRKGELPKAD